MKLIISTCLYVCAILTVNTLLSPTKSSASEPRKPIHHMVLIHGVMGDVTTFEGMSEALRVHLSKKRPDFKWFVHTYVYQTGRKEKASTYQFAVELNDFLKKRLNPESENSLQPGDKVSFITHSQGGIISGIWIYMSAAGHPEFKSGLLPFVDTSISLGTPYWGSRLGALMDYEKSISKITGAFDDYKDEFADMAALSDKSFDSKISVINLATRPELYELIKNIQFVNIAGRAPSLQVGTYMSSDLLTSDSDWAVEIPSANMNLLYARITEPSQNIDYNDPWKEVLRQREQSLKTFKDIKIADLYVVPGSHMSPNHDSKTSLTVVPKDCVSNIDCGHSTLKIIVNSLAKQQKQNLAIEKQKNNSTTFFVIFNIRLPFYKTYDIDDVSIYEDVRNGDSFEWIPQGKMIQKKLITFQDRLPEIHRYTESQVGSVMINDARVIKTGRFFKRPKDPSAINAYTTFTISAPGTKPKYIKVPLRVDQTTFVDIDLD